MRKFINEVYRISQQRYNDDNVSYGLEYTKTDNWHQVGVIGDFNVFSSPWGDTYFLRTPSGEGAAYLELGREIVDGETAFAVDEVGVKPKFRGLRLAFRLYIFLICKRGITLVCGDKQTPGGQALWDALADDDRVDLFVMDSSRIARPLGNMPLRAIWSDDDEDDIRLVARASGVL